MNIGVWLIEQLTSIDFEFLAISYIISELFLLGVYLVMNEMQRLKDLIQQKEAALQATSEEKPRKVVNISQDDIEVFTQGLDTLTPTERIIYNAYLAGKSSKEVMSELNIKENTLKFHNKNLYSKLGVSSRKQLLSIVMHLSQNPSAMQQNTPPHSGS